jgi:DNA-binding NtrC family response regulator
MKKNILVVGNDRNLRRTLSLILRHAGYAVMTVPRIQEAYRRLHNRSYNLVIVDSAAPGSEWEDSAAEIRCLFPDIPVILLTGHASRESYSVVGGRGISGYLIKPIDPAYILEYVDEILATDRSTA